MVRLFYSVLLAIVLQAPVLADERILSFVSDVVVMQDGSLNVVETITVQAEGKNIKRGIYRDLPTSYPHAKYGQFGFKSKTPVQVVSVTRNGESESWHGEDLDNGRRTFFGRANRNINPGVHTYKFNYITDRQIAESDENAILYWNVTGNGWRFPIDSAQVNVTLPDGSEVFDQMAWTGRQGSTVSNSVFEPITGSNVTATTTRALGAWQGLTVKIFFDSTSLNLTTVSSWQLLFQDNKRYFFGLAFLLVMLIFYVVVWFIKGRDPELGIVIARYRPLQDLSAGAHRAIYRNTVDQTSFAVGVLSAAIKGHLHIHKKKENVFKLEANKEVDLDNLSLGERLLVNRLFASVDTVTLGEQYSSKIKELKKDYANLLKNEYAKPAHVQHLPALVFGLILGVIGLFLIIQDIDSFFEYLSPAIFITTFVMMFSYKAAKQNNLSSMLVFAGCVTLAGLYACMQGQLNMGVPLAYFGFVFGLFAYLLPSPKLAGQKLINKIEGFKLYLSKAEHESLKRLDLPNKTPQLYEELLPFAIALDLETQWSDQFIDVLADAARDGANGSQYHSSWYHGSGDFGGASSFAPALAAGLASSVVAASTPPSSSSSSGGGSSGGGGGGGGGGGW